MSGNARRSALPSKGRLMEQCNAALAKAGLTVVPIGPGARLQGRDRRPARRRGQLRLVGRDRAVPEERRGAPRHHRRGPDPRDHGGRRRSACASCAPLGFGRADVVVAVPACWLDVRRMADLEEMSLAYRRVHGRRVRVATKYMNLTRRFFAQKGVTGYRIVESLGATEGAPAAGLAELIVDITTTGATLKANGLKVLDDGLILKSQANLIASKAAPLDARAAALEQQIAARFAVSLSSRNFTPSDAQMPAIGWS